MVSSGDVSRLGSRRWFRRPDGYVARSTTVMGQPKTLYIHRDILNPRQDLEVDHINGDKLDNRRVNLRSVTRSENLQNSGPRKTNKLGVRGVYFDPTKNRFRVYKTINGVKKHLGDFHKIDDANNKYKEVTRSLYERVHAESA